MPTSDQLRDYGRRGGQARAAHCDMIALGGLGGSATVGAHGTAHMASIGRAGARATISKYGARFLADKLRQHRRGNPTRLEQIVDAALQALGLVEGEKGDYEREAFVFADSDCHLQCGDFVFRRQKLVLYADGKHWHEDNPHVGNRLAIDADNDEYLASRGWRVVRLPERLIVHDPRGLTNTLQAAIYNEMHSENHNDPADLAW